jgi:signal transduction histidine kinase/HAMP domain-containing protein
MFRNLTSLRARLIFLILMAVVPAFGLILYSAAKHREVTANQVKQNALVAARVIASEQDRVLSNANQFLITLAGLPQIRENDRATCRKILSGLLEPRYADLVVADKNGNPLCTALPPSSSIASASGLHHARSIETYDFSVGNLRYHQASAKILLDVGYPVADKPGLIRAVVSAALDLSWINQVTIDSHLYPGATYSLVSSTGIVLMRYPGSSDWIGKPIFSQATEQSLVSNTEKTIEANGPDGLPRMFAFSRLKGRIGGQVVYAAIDLPATLAIAKTKEILIENLIALGVVSAIILSLAWFGADAFVLRRIRDIIAATNKVAEGNLGARTTLLYGTSELGHMARAFDNLAEALEKREAEALESAKRIKQQRKQQEALYDLNRGITSTLDLTSVVTILLDHITALFPGCAVTVSCVNKDTNDLDSIAHRGFVGTEQGGAKFESALLPLLVLKQQSPVAISNARNEPNAPYQDFLLRNKLISYLGLPLVAKSEILGVLSFYTHEEREFTREEIDFLNALINEAAIAIYNSRLFEQAREQAIELERSNKIKDEFLGVMSHELRTPLNIIMNYSEALKMGTFGAISRDQELGTDKIRAQASHLLSLINGILEITKIESGTAIVQTDSIDLADFMSESKSDYMLPLNEDLKLEWNYAGDMPTIVSDRVKLKQILTNLINNAIKFTVQGHVRVSARVATDRKTFEFEVADSGPGIPEKSLPFIFEKFRQVDSASTRSYAGAGLGLFIVKNFVDLLGGKIDVRSTVGEGSIFSVRLPLRSVQKRMAIATPLAEGSVAHSV